MASTRVVVPFKNIQLHLLLLAMLMINVVFARRMMRSESGQEDQDMLFQYHKGPLLTGKIAINLIWYGKFKPSERAIVSDFITSLSSPPSQEVLQQPSVALWLKSIDKYYSLINAKNSIQPTLGSQILDEQYSVGKSLKLKQIEELAAKGSSTDHQTKNALINVVLTSSDVAVEGFCSSKCGTHGSLLSNKGNNKFAYVWVGNSETQCPGQCAWPFHQPIYGPQNPPLVAPNNDVGMDGIVMNLASLLAGTFTNPFGNGYYQGPATAPLEAASACPGVFGKGAYPGYAGNLLVDSATGASYNAHAVNGRKFLLPALYDPTSNSCSTLV